MNPAAVSVPISTENRSVLCALITEIIFGPNRAPVAATVGVWPTRWPSRAPAEPPSSRWTRRLRARGGRIRPDGAGEASRMSVGRSGMDRRRRPTPAPRNWSGEVVPMPSGRLHAVSAAGLVVGRALCLAPVTLLDPRDWRWPDDGEEEGSLCWICLALTRVQS